MTETVTYNVIIQLPEWSQKGGKNIINQIDILRAARIKQKLTQEQLAKKLNISVRTLLRWELKQREPPYTKFLEWSDILGVPLNQLSNHPKRA